MRAGLNVVRFKQLDILRQLRLEELLLRTTPYNWAIINSGQVDKSIVVGFSGKVAELLNVDRVKEHQVRVLRRYTGGGTVIVDNSTVFASFIMNAKEMNCAPYPREIMAWSSDNIYNPIFADQRTEFSLRENDYVIKDKKFGGNAQTITKDRWVHHTSLLWDFDPENMKYLQIPKKRPEYRQDREHQDFLTTLNQRFASVQAFEDRLVQQLESAFDVTHLSPGEVFDMEASLRTTHAANIGKLIRTQVEEI